MVFHRLWYDHMTTSKGPPRTARKTAGTRSSTSAERRHRALRDSRMRCSAALELQDGFLPDQNGNHWGNKSSHVQNISRVALNKLLFGYWRLPSGLAGTEVSWVAAGGRRWNTLMSKLNPFFSTVKSLEFSLFQGRVYSSMPNMPLKSAISLCSCFISGTRKPRLLPSGSLDMWHAAWKDVGERTIRSCGKLDVWPFYQRFGGNMQ